MKFLGLRPDKSRLSDYYTRVLTIFKVVFVMLSAVPAAERHTAVDLLLAVPADLSYLPRKWLWTGLDWGVAPCIK